MLRALRGDHRARVTLICSGYAHHDPPPEGDPRGKAKAKELSPWGWTDVRSSSSAEESSGETGLEIPGTHVLPSCFNISAASSEQRSLQEAWCLEVPCLRSFSCCARRMMFHGSCLIESRARDWHSAADSAQQRAWTRADITRYDYKIRSGNLRVRP